MPNWVRNRVCPVDPNDMKKLIAALTKRNEAGRTLTNFDGVIPMPKELHDTPCEFGNAEIDRRKEENRRKYGYPTWYEFAVDRWGTKWDNNEVTAGDCELSFDTAWDMPEGVYRKISETIPIIVAYADEDIGYNCGLCRFENGEILNLRDGIGGTDTQFANAVWEYYSEDESSIDEYSMEVKDRLNAVMNGEEKGE